MAGSVNRVTLIGNLGRDPETRSFQSGGKVCSLRVACSEAWRDKTSGERKERVEWIAVAIYNEALVKIAEQYLRKGSKIYLEGKLETRKWQDQSGADRYVTEVTLRPFNGELVLLDGKPDGGRPDAKRDDGYQSPEGYGRSSGYGAGGSPMDDDIPFAPIR